MFLFFAKDGVDDVLTPPMTTLYSQVWWSPLAPAPFPPEIVARYNGSAMAIVGWEIDQVRRLPNGEDVSVPISASYNHHYNAQAIGGCPCLGSAVGTLTTTHAAADDCLTCVRNFTPCVFECCLASGGA